MEKVIKGLLEQYGVNQMGFARLERPLSLSFYQNWLENSFQGNMEYLKEHLPLKSEPHSLMAGARSAIVLAYPYSTQEWSHNFPLKHLKVASYARKKDYHRWLKQKVDSLCKDLKQLFPTEEFLGFTDAAPIMERDLAHRAGLGWFGKNTCLIDKKNGSLFFIAEIYTSLDLSPPQDLPHDHCGTCNRCVEACPTGALLENKTLDATKCISYWTIEEKSVPEESLRENFQGWLFGCDVCQDVCPWNGKIARSIPSPTSDGIAQELKWILNSSHHQIMKLLKHTPLARAGARGLKRNALIVAGNLKVQEVLKDVAAYQDDQQLGELARWSINKISSTTCSSSISHIN